jgi:hypothetical protein
MAHVLTEGNKLRRNAMDEIKSEFQESKRNSEVMVSFGARLYNQFTINESFRFAKEQQWLEDLRAYKGLYDPDTKISANASKVYPKITRSKINIVLSRLHEMLFPETDKNFEIKATPDPKIALEIVEKIIQGLMQQKAMEIQMAAQEKQVGSMPGNPPEIQPPTTDEVRLAIKAFAEATCEAMSKVIDDQLGEMDYPEETKKVLRSGLLYGTGIMKGPMINKRSKHKWEPGPNGDYKEASEQEDVPFFQAIRIWDWYPDMTVTELSMIEGSFERHMFSKHDLRQLIDREDYYGEIIKTFLEEHPNGNYVAKNWEIQLQTIEMEAGAKNTTTTTGYTDTNSTNRATNRQIGKKYEVLEFWGYIDGTDLEACGVNIPDVTLEYAANVWMIGKTIISARLFEGALNRYKIFYYEKDETSLYGEGLARVMRHSQIAIASSARMVLDNAAVISGPQVELNWSLITPGQDMSSFYPRKIWYREGRGIEAQYPAIRNLSFDSHIDELIGVSKFFMEFADIETTLPTWLAGQMVNNETAQATSGRQATITVSIKDVVKNFDAFTEHIIQDLYAWNMEFNPRSDIKGDYNVKARGVSSLVMKEIRMQALNQLATTFTPEDWVYMDRREFIKERLKAHDLNIPLKTEEEADKIREKQANSIANKLQMDLMASEISKNKAQALVNLTKAKEKNVEANKAAETPPEIPENESPEMKAARLEQENAKTDDQRTKTALTVDKHNMEKELMAADMERQDQKHLVEMASKIDEHKTSMGIKKDAAAHGMKMKEKAANKPKVKSSKEGGK